MNLKTKIIRPLTLFFSFGWYWEEFRNMLVSNAVYRTAKCIHSSSFPVSWHIVKIVALNQWDFPKEQHVQSKQKHPSSVLTSHNVHQRICVLKHFWHMTWGGCTWSSACKTAKHWRKWGNARFSNVHYFTILMQTSALVRDDKNLKIYHFKVWFLNFWFKLESWWMSPHFFLLIL